MVSRGKELPVRSNFSKVPVNRKRPEKGAPAKQRHGPNASRKTIQKRKASAPSGIVRANNSSRRTVLLDACNVSHFSPRMPNFTVDKLKKAIKFFRNKDNEVYAVLPRFHLYTGKWDSPGTLQELYRKNYLVPTPCKEYPNPKSQVYDDRILLSIAHAYNCVVVSNDRFRDIAHENPDWNHVAMHNRVEFDFDRYGQFGIIGYRESLFD